MHLEAKGVRQRSPQSGRYFPGREVSAAGSEKHLEIRRAWGEARRQIARHVRTAIAVTLLVERIDAERGASRADLRTLIGAHWTFIGLGALSSLSLGFDMTGVESGRFYRYVPTKAYRL
jgi:hypothetical protein